jgi:sigma-B regulation protein RsbU (phosphoserine phosphatase)
LFSNLTAGMPLKDIVESANRFLCDRDLSEKYATMVVVRLKPDGVAEYINCGQVSPVLVQDGKVTRPDVANVPVGMMSDVKFETGTFHLAKGARLLLVTDGITEAENKEYEFFGDVRLEKHVAENDPIEKIVAAVQKYRNHVPLADDVTLLDLEYNG